MMINGDVLKAVKWVLDYDDATLTVGDGYAIATYSWGHANYTVRVVSNSDGLRATATVDWGSADYYDQWLYDGDSRRWVYTGFRDSDPGLPWGSDDDDQKADGRVDTVSR